MEALEANQLAPGALYEERYHALYIVHQNCVSWWLLAPYMKDTIRSTPRI